MIYAFTIVLYTIVGIITGILAMCIFDLENPTLCGLLIILWPVVWIIFMLISAFVTLFDEIDHKISQE